MKTTNQQPIPLQPTNNNNNNNNNTKENLHIIVAQSNHIPHSISTPSDDNNEQYQNSFSSPPTSSAATQKTQDLRHQVPAIKINNNNIDHQFNHLDWQEGQSEEQEEQEEEEEEEEEEIDSGSGSDSDSTSDQEEEEVEDDNNNNNNHCLDEETRNISTWKRLQQQHQCNNREEEREPLVHSDHNDPNMDDPYSYNQLDTQPYRRHSNKRRQRRKVYGGGRLDWGGELEIWEVGLGVASDILSPAPLFIPHVFLLLGLPIGLPALFLVGFLAWFSQVVLVVCGRYVGGRTYAQIASAVLPDRWKGCNVWFGETMVELCRVFVAGGRGMVNMMVVSDLFSQLTHQYTPEASLLYSRVFIIFLVGLLSLIPNFVLPRRPFFLPASFPTLSRLPLLLTILWPISISIIGFRLLQLNKELGRKLPPTGEGDIYSEIMAGTIWGGFTMLLFCLTTPQHTFKHFRSLKRINKPPGNTTHPMRPLLNNPTDELAPIPDPFFSGSNRSSIFSSYTLRRYSWESAGFLGVTYSTLICLSWGLVGYLGMENGGFEVNFLASLPTNDGWISTARVLLLIVLIPSIPLSLRPATTALLHLIKIPSILNTASSRRKKIRRRGGDHHQRMETHEWDDRDEDSGLIGSNNNKQQQEMCKVRLVTCLVWFGIAIGAIQLGGSNGGEGSTIEILGCVGSTIITGLLPAGFWIVLFHIRKARPILNIDQSNNINSESNRPNRRTTKITRLNHQNQSLPLQEEEHGDGNGDNLLLIKEAQLQKRLSGRRIWQDIAVFGLLIPFSLVVFLKGLSAISIHSSPSPNNNNIKLPSSIY